MNKRVFFALLVVSSVASGQEERVTLQAGPGRDLVIAHCAVCHSLDYIPMNSPFLDKAGWEKSVNKMVKVMGAPITEQDIPAIIEYLATAYGK